MDTAEAVFEVDDFENYVHVQSEAALRSKLEQALADQGISTPLGRVVLVTAARYFNYVFNPTIDCVVTNRKPNKAR